MHKLFLASKSPRRHELLTQNKYEFETIHVKVSEIIEQNLNSIANAMNIAKTKGQEAKNQLNLLKLKDFLVLSADTIVTLNKKIYGKPSSDQEAVHFLLELSGKLHSVITGVYIFDSESQSEIQSYCMTKVQFKNLSEYEISNYIKTGEPFDKAGGYGIQGLARTFIEKIEGSYSNVVGLPMELVNDLRERYGWKFNKK